MMWAGARAMTALLDDDRAGALDALGRGIDAAEQPQSPGHYRGMWPLLLAAEGARAPRPRWPRPGTSAST